MEAIGITIGMIMAAMIVNAFIEIARRLINGTETFKSLRRIAYDLINKG